MRLHVKYSWRTKLHYFHSIYKIMDTFDVKIAKEDHKKKTFTSKIFFNANF